MAAEISLGAKVRDRVSGFEGHATSRHQDFTGCVQWGVQPPINKKAPDSYPEAMCIDQVQLTYVGVGQKASAGKTMGKLPFKLGDEVEDLVSGYKGIATCRNDWLNGCTTVRISGKAKEGDAPPKTSHYPVQAIRRIGDGLNAPDKAAATEKAKPEGGPTTKAERY